MQTHGLTLYNAAYLHNQIYFSLYQMISFRPIKGVDLLKNINFGVSLHHISTKYSEHHRMLGIMPWVFPAPFNSCVMARKAH